MKRNSPAASLLLLLDDLKISSNLADSPQEKLEVVFHFLRCFYSSKQHFLVTWRTREATSGCSVCRCAEILILSFQRDELYVTWHDFSTGSFTWNCFQTGRGMNKGLYFFVLFCFVTHLLPKVGQRSVVLNLCVFLVGFMGSYSSFTHFLGGCFWGFWGQETRISPSEGKKKNSAGVRIGRIYSFTLHPKLLRKRSWGGLFWMMWV